MQFENIKIKKVNLSGRELTVEYDEINVPESGDGLVVTNSVKKKCEQICHDDLIAAFNRLVPHFALLSEIRTVPEAYLSDDDSAMFDECTLQSICKDIVRVTGLQITYSLDGDTVKISGFKYTKHSAVSFDAPQCQSSSTQYPYIDNLFEAVENVKSEVYAYLFEGKCAIRQAELFDDSLDATITATVTDDDGEVVSLAQKAVKKCGKGKKQDKKVA